MAADKLTYAQAVDFILSQAPEASIAHRDWRATQDTFIEALDQLGNPQDAQPAIHIAGTSGKGTIAMILTDILVRHGFSVGTTLSPHVYDVRERVLVNGQLISKADFAAGASELQELFNQLKQRDTILSFFELITALGFVIAAKHKLDYHVVETGMGGRLDATNTITRRDKLAVISKIGLDHMPMLGTNLEEIAGEKAGIITSDQAIVLDQPELNHIFSDAAEKHNSAIEFIAREQYQSFFTQPTSRPMQDNAALAFRAAEYLAERDGWKLEPVKCSEVLVDFNMPGRLEQQEIGGKMIVYDGAHNPQKTEALLEGLQFKFPDLRFGVVFATSHQEHVDDILALLKPISQRTILTNFHDPILRSFRPLVTFEGREDGLITDDHQQIAIEMLDGEVDKWLVTGSFYILGEIKSALQKHTDSAS